MESPLLYCTGQLWKLWLAIVVTALSGSYQIAAWFSPLELSSALAWVLDGVVAGVSVWACTSIRCPRCALKLLWHVVRTSHVLEYVFDIQNLSECPRCRFRCDSG